jgi:hypothetical protein
MHLANTTMQKDDRNEQKRFHGLGIGHRLFGDWDGLG